MTQINKHPATLYTLSEILKNRFFRIPDYQRGYSWEESQLNDIVKDIENLFQKDYVHFTGTLVASPVGDSQLIYEMVDGQQRLTSLTILLSELYRQNKANPEFESIWSEYVIRGDIGNTQLVLESNIETKDYFYNCIIKNEDLTPEIKSHECIRFAKVFFREWLTSKPDDHKSILDAILNKMGFIFFTPRNDKEIGIMFEVINNRGKQLSELEKVKNYFIYYSTVHGFTSLRNEINIVWKDLQRYLNQAHITSNEAENDFLRYCLIIVFDARKGASHYAYDNLKSRFNINESNEQDRVDSVAQMTSFIDFLKHSARHIAFLNNRSFYESNYSGSLKKELGDVLLLLRCMPTKASILPLYLSVMMRWHEEHFKSKVVEIVRLLEILNFRVYVLPGISSRADSGQGTTFWLAHHFFKRKDWTVDDYPSPWESSSWTTEIKGDVFDWLGTEIKEFTYDKCNDKQLIQALSVDNFEAINFYNWGQGLRYFLANYEQHLYGQVKRSWDIDQILLTREELGKEHQNDYLSIEHIWASNNRSADFPHEEMQKRRLGNFVLLGMGFNSSFKDIDIPDKIKAMQDWNNQNRGAITLFQVAELQLLVKNAESFVESNRSRRTKNFYCDLAMRLCDERETSFIKYAVKRWAVPGINETYEFKEVNSFETKDLESHYIVIENAGSD